MHYRLLLFTVLFFGLQVCAILDGDPVAWSRNAFLVKVFARNQGLEVSQCTGVLISNNLVLTSASCVKNPKTNEVWRDFAVKLSVPNFFSHDEKASLVEQQEDWALLTISEIKNEYICPALPEPRNVLRINLKPTLKNTSILTITPDEIIGSKCYFVAFKTTEKASWFWSVTKVLRVNVDILRSNNENNYYRSVVTNNRTACFDDGGGPLICETTHHGTMLVGLFQSLGVNDSDDVEIKNPEHCLLAREMYFSLIVTNNYLIDFIEQFEIARLVTTYAACGFLHS